MFQALKLAGSAYLVFLGLQALSGAFRSRREGTSLPAAAPLGPAAAFRQGLLSNLANPKTLAFFTSLLPQFASSFPGLLALGLLFCGLTLAWLTAYTLAVSKASGFLRRPRVRRAVEALTGTVLVALGLRPRYRVALGAERPGRAVVVVGRDPDDDPEAVLSCSDGRGRRDVDPGISERRRDLGDRAHALVALNQERLLRRPQREVELLRGSFELGSILWDQIDLRLALAGRETEEGEQVDVGVSSAVSTP